jgi:AraC-like DNA-binding protein
MHREGAASRDPPLDLIFFVETRRDSSSLGDPRFAHQSISSIAFNLGFSDLSDFNRTFRRRHEATPTEVRAEAIHSGTPPAASGSAASCSPRSSSPP